MSCSCAGSGPGSAPEPGRHQFSTTIAIHAAPERVRAVMVDVDRWPEWTESIRRVQRLDDGPLAVGARARVFQPGLPPAVWQVTALDEGGGGEGPLGGVLAWLTRGVNDRYIGMEAAGLKRRFEAT
ncbi:MAG: SRPBCC family protein [Gemmatimonadetes bacterium]|nr:SRPBCC family protein [Gemmatimonadota bacterium]